MVNEFAMVAIGAATGLVTGGTAGWLVSRSRPAPIDRPHGLIPVDPSVDDAIEEAARQWATAHGMPEASGLIARKIRLGITLQGRKKRRF